MGAMLIASSPAGPRRRASSAMSDVLRYRGVRTPREPPAEHRHQRTHRDRHRELQPIPRVAEPAVDRLVVEDHLHRHIREEPPTEPDDPPPAVPHLREPPGSPAD